MTVRFPASPPDPGHTVIPNLHPPARMKPGAGGRPEAAASPGAPPPPGPMVVHAPNLWGWRVGRFAVTGGPGGGVHARDGGGGCPAAIAG